MPTYAEAATRNVQSRGKDGKEEQLPARKSNNENKQKWKPRGGIDGKITKQMADLLAENNSLKDTLKEKNAEPPKKTKSEREKEKYDELPTSGLIGNTQVDKFSIHCGKRPKFEINVTWLVFSTALSVLSYIFGFNLILPFFNVTGQVFYYTMNWYHYTFPVILTIAVFWLHRFGSLSPNHIKITYSRPFLTPPTKDERPDVVGLGDLKHKDPFHCYVYTDSYSRTKVEFLFNFYYTEFRFSRCFDYLCKRKESLISLELYTQLAVSKFANNMDTDETVFSNIDYAARNFQSINLSRIVSLYGAKEKFVVNNTAKVAFYAYREYMEHSDQDFLLPPTRALHFYTATASEKLISPLSQMLKVTQSFLQLYRWILLAGLLCKFLLPLLL